MSVQNRDGMEPGPGDVQRVVEILNRRMARLGWRSAVEIVGTNRVSLKAAIRHEAQIATARQVLVRGGFLEFRLVHEESKKFLEQDITPPFYQIMKEARLQPDGTKVLIPHLIRKEAVPGLSGKNIKQADVTRGGMNEPQIAFKFDAVGTAAFAKVTGENTGRQLAILLDGVILSAPNILEPITGGSAIISGGSFDKNEASSLAASLGSPLEAVVKILEEKNSDR